MGDDLVEGVHTKGHQETQKQILPAPGQSAKHEHNQLDQAKGQGSIGLITAPLIPSEPDPKVNGNHAAEVARAGNHDDPLDIPPD